MRYLILCFCLANLVTCHGPHVQALSQNPPLLQEDGIHPKMNQALVLLAKTWSAMDRVGDKIWPGWRGAQEEAVFIVIPQVQDMLVNFSGELPPEFVRLKSKVHGKTLDLRSPSPEKRSHGGASARIGGKKFSLVAVSPRTPNTVARSLAYMTQSLKKSKSPPYLENYLRSPICFMKTIVHEAFHCYQKRRGPDSVQNFYSSQWRDALDFRRAVLSALESRILLKAYGTQDSERLKDLIHQFLAVRCDRREGLNSERIAWENGNEWTEGVAWYVECCFLEALGPDSVHQQHMKDFLLGSVRSTDNPSYRYYYSGGFMAFLLDRLCGNLWKEEYFEKGCALDGLLARYSEVKAKDFPRLLEKAYGDFAIEQLKKEVEQDFPIQKDNPPFDTERITRGEGKRYHIDGCSKFMGPVINVAKVRPRSRGWAVRGGTVYPDGFEHMIFGSGKLTTENTPIFIPTLSAFYGEWLDTRFDADYHLRFKSRKGNIYTEVSLKTRGFTYSAKRAEIRDQGGDVWIWTLE